MTSKSERGGWRYMFVRTSAEKVPWTRRRYGSDRSSDLIVAGLGIALGLVCAFFPWYVFFNQEKFGIRAVQFSGSEGTQLAPGELVYQPSLIGQRISIDDVPLLELDQIATGTVPDDADPAAQEVSLSDQPFPGDEHPAPEFRVVHIANGRAMIEDEEGLYVVQTGSILPDKSRVASIEERGGNWVVVTSLDTVVPLAE
ncbi:MAG: hypothetical protein JJ913_11470 [Rhizobiaceae bacterium]|nr:hypothetical protein [Rhizobiaceae bacterium]